jgi:hypothetical protein
MSGHARRDHPETSHEAAVRVEASGQVERDADLLLRLVAATPGHTIPEYAGSLCEDKAKLEFYRQRLGRRTGDLVKKGLIHAKGKRDGCQCWFPGKGVENGSKGQGDLFGEEEKWQKWQTD